jgi:hypothetical protein
MSVTAEPPTATETDHSCLSCGASLGADQEWCIECGAARTLIHRPPDWRLPVAVVGSVIVLVLAGVVFGLIELSADANRSATTVAARAAAPVTPAAGAHASTSGGAPVGTASATTTPGSSAAATSFPDWPVGLGGWTVVLAVNRNRAAAVAAATRLASSGVSVGVLDSTQHPKMPAGYWVVFSGRYPTQADAMPAALRLRAAGNHYAHARIVAPPGG